MPTSLGWARSWRGLVPIAFFSIVAVVAIAAATATDARALASARRGLAAPRFQGAAAVRPPPPAGAHRVGEAAIWAPLTTIVTAMPGPAPLSVGVITMLHGACGAPLPTCATFADDATTRGASPIGPSGSILGGEPASSSARRSNWLVCPMGNARCDDGGLDWLGSGDDKATHLDAIRDEVDARYGGLMGDREILAGFSRGAFVARDVAYARPHRYRALILIGAAVRLEPQRLRDNGIERVALVSGQYDGARPTMVAATARLVAQGLPARFFDAGPIYHELPPDMGRLMAEIVAWIDGVSELPARQLSSAIDRAGSPNSRM